MLKFVQTIPLKPTDPGYDIVSDTAASLAKFARRADADLLWGMKDFVFDRHFLAEWQRHFPHAEIHTWPDCGHYLLEDAGDEAIMRVKEFLAKHPDRHDLSQHVRLRPLNVAAHLARMAAAYPDRAAHSLPSRPRRTRGRRPLIGHLIRRTERRLPTRSPTASIGVGITRGMRTVLMVPPSPDFFALTFALFKVAAVPVLIDPGMGVQEPRHVPRRGGAGSVHRHPEGARRPARCSAGRKKTIRTTVNVGRRRFFCTALARRGCAKPAANTRPVPDPRCRGATRPAAILFTSGSTGVAKGAVYTHGIFAAQVEMLKATYGIEPGEIDLCTFPLFALFGPALGMTCVIPDMDPIAARDASTRARPSRRFEQFGVTNLFGSPAVIRRLAELASGGRSPRCCRRADVTARHAARVISAGAPAVGRGDRALREAAPRRRRGLHALRRDRSAAGREHRQPRDPGRDAAPDGPGQGRLRRPAGGGNDSSRHSDLPTSRSRSGTNRLLCRRARSARSSCAGRS